MEKCVAYVAKGFHEYPCLRPATKSIGSLNVCTTHAKQAQKWDEQGRLARMVSYWWHAKLTAKEGEGA